MTLPRFCHNATIQLAISIVLGVYIVIPSCHAWMLSEPLNSIHPPLSSSSSSCPLSYKNTIFSSTRRWQKYNNKNDHHLQQQQHHHHLIYPLRILRKSTALCNAKISVTDESDDDVDTDMVSSPIYGLMNDFDRKCNIDNTLQYLGKQIPTSLTVPLTIRTASMVYTKDFQACVKFVQINNGTEDGNDVATSSSPTTTKTITKTKANVENENDDDSEISLFQSRDELISISDVLVIATAGAQRTNDVLKGSGSISNNNGVGNEENNKNNDGTTQQQQPQEQQQQKEVGIVQYQLIIDQSLKSIMIPWKVDIPTLGAPNINQKFEGLSEYVLTKKDNKNNNNSSNNSKKNGKVQKHILRNVQWNGQLVNGPTIGRTLKSTKQAVENIQKNPILQTFLSAASSATSNGRGSGSTSSSSGSSSSGGNFLFRDLRDGFLEQAAKTMSDNSNNNKSKVDSTTSKKQRRKDSLPNVIVVDNVNSVTGWIDEKQKKTTKEQGQGDDGDDDSSTTKNTILNKDKNNENHFFPLPGTKDWKDYVMLHIAIEQFYDEILPYLAKGIGGTTSNSISNNSRRRSVQQQEDDVDIKNLFSSNVTFVSTNNDILMKGNGLVSSFYQSVALTRQGTGGIWTLEKCSLLDWKKRKMTVVPSTSTTKTKTKAKPTKILLANVAVDYTYTDTIPPWTIEGRDVYTLRIDCNDGKGEKNMDGYDDDDDDDDGDDDDDDQYNNCNNNVRVYIEQIKQDKFIAMTTDGSITLDTNWIMNNLISSVERGQMTTSTNARNVLSNIFTSLQLQPQQQQPSSPIGFTGQTNSSRRRRQDNLSKKSLSKEAAANVYYIMMDIHEKCNRLFYSATDNTNNNDDDDEDDDILYGLPPPDIEYLSDTMELHGYLDETLLRGSNILYVRSIQTIISNVQQLINDKRLIYSYRYIPTAFSSSSSYENNNNNNNNNNNEGNCRVELLSNGNVIRVSLTLDFRIPPPPAVAELLSPTITSSSSNTNIGTRTTSTTRGRGGGGGGGLPLKLEIISDYKFDMISTATSSASSSSTALSKLLIYQHQLIETRINGQLTPADVLSRTIQRLMNGGKESRNGNTTPNADDIFKILGDTIDWFRKLS